jgi:hypothetical protein
MGHARVLLAMSARLLNIMATGLAVVAGVTQELTSTSPSRC